MTAGVALGLIGFGWLATATIVRFVGGGANEFLLIPNPASHLVIWTTAAAAILLVVRGESRRLLAWTWLLACTTLTPPLTFLAFDLRWWWIGLIAISVITSWPGVTAALCAWAHGRWATGTLAAGVVAFAVASGGWQPAIVLHGDEPKYVRIAENLYQGRGFDVSSKQTIEVADAGPHLWQNLSALPDVIVTEARQLVRDVRWWLGQSAPPPLRSQPPSPGLFFQGKHAGTVYQVHTPGLSLVLLPAYYLDRRWTGGGVGYQGEFPDGMPAVTAMTLGLLAGLALAIHALLLAAGAGRVAALVVAGVSAVVMPAGAFAFQIYPETCGGIIVALLVRWLIAERVNAWWPPVGYGMLAGLLPWLHLRFSLVALVAVVWTVAYRRHDVRTLLTFVGAALSGFLTLACYTYRLTGSFVPVATYGESLPLSIERVSHGVPAFFFDRTFGLLAHSPVYTLALVGAVCLWRSRPRLAVLATLMFLAIVLPAAGHGYWAAGATPSRYLVAAVPLLALALMAAGTALVSSRWMAGGAATLVLLSISTAWQYNAFFRKDLGLLVAPSLSGWRLNLAFPDMGSGWNLGMIDWLLLSSWLGLAVIVLAMVARSRRSSGPVYSGAGVAHKAMVCLVLGGIASSGLTSVTGRRTSSAYEVSTSDARAAVLTRAAELKLRARGVSSNGQMVDPIEVVGNDPGGVDIRSETEAGVGKPIRFRVRPRTSTGDFLLSDVLVDFGDGHALTFARHVGDVEVRHVFHQPGIYTVRAEVVWAGVRLNARTDVTVR